MRRYVGLGIMKLTQVPLRYFRAMFMEFLAHETANEGRVKHSTRHAPFILFTLFILGIFFIGSGRVLNILNYSGAVLDSGDPRDMEQEKDLAERQTEGKNMTTGRGSLWKQELMHEGQ